MHTAWYHENNVHLYKFVESNPSGPLRNKETYKEDCENQNHGIKGIIGLSELRFLSPLNNTNIDYMHSVLGGVVKRFFRYWFDIKCEQSIKTHTIEIDKRLLSIKPPHFIPINPRSIEQRAKWRANEYLTFLLYYSLPILNGILEPKYFLNLMKLVVSMECLLNRRIKRENLTIFNNIPISFVKEVQEIYPIDIMVLGMHELLHLVECTLAFGPLNYINSFQFEELNRKILSLIFGKDLLGDEFLKLFRVLQALTFYSYTNNNQILKEYFENHNIVKTSNKKRLTSVNTGVFTPLNDVYLASTEITDRIKSTDPNALLPLKCCTRLSFNGIVYTNSDTNTRRCDYCVKTVSQPEEFGLIELFVFNEVKVYVILKKTVYLISPFFDPCNPKIISQTFLCSLTKRNFITTIENISKVFLIN